MRFAAADLRRPPRSGQAGLVGPALACVGVLAFLLVPIVVIVPLSADSSFLAIRAGLVAEVVREPVHLQRVDARRAQQLHRRTGGHRDRHRAGHAHGRRPRRTDFPFKGS